MNIDSPMHTYRREFHLTNEVGEWLTEALEPRLKDVTFKFQYLEFGEDSGTDFTIEVPGAEPLSGDYASFITDWGKAKIESYLRQFFGYSVKLETSFLNSSTQEPFLGPKFIQVNDV